MATVHNGNGSRRTIHASTPSVYVLASPSFDAATFSRFLSTQHLDWRRTTGASPAEELVEAAGRICYLSFGENQSPRTNEEFIQNLVRMGHESVLEHISWTFLIVGVTRAFTHQLVRHRAGFSFSQLSQQYHDERDATFVMPAELNGVPGAPEAWKDIMETTKRAYGTLDTVLREHEESLPKDLDKKEVNRAIRSAARSVLPNATETKIVVTANARALRHFLKVRGGIPGDREMREVAAALFTILTFAAPALFFDFQVKHLSDGSPQVHHETNLEKVLT
jgi:thymidylate synthase (FAD)